MPNIHDLISGIEEEVSGTIIGDVTFPYEFWTTGEPYGQHRIDRNSFTDDESAVEWFKEKYPEWFKKGVEMRVFDKGMG